MTLSKDARELADTLKKIVDGLESYEADSRRDYTSKVAARLKPLVQEFERLITEERSKEAAKMQLDDIRKLMHNINGAATKGEIDFVQDCVLNRYWQLSTIFQEAKYSHESL